MARRKSKSRVARTRSYATKRSTRRKSSSKGLGGFMANSPVKLYPIGYGFVRTKLANILDPVTSKIPMGEFSDEIAIGLLAYFIGKKVPILKPFAETALVVENYRVGELLANKVGPNQKESSNVYVYGA